MLEKRLDRIYEAVLDCEKEQVEALVRDEIARGTALEKILEECLIAAMDEVGDQYAAGTVFVPEMLAAAEAMKAGLEVLRPHLAGARGAGRGTIVIGTVAGDLHDIGKNLVAMMLEGAGFEVVDLGVDVPPARFVEAAREHGAAAVGLSALLTSTLPAMRETAGALRDAGYNGAILVGGAPVDATFAGECGADGYADDAPGAVALARRVVGEDAITPRRTPPPP